MLFCHSVNLAINLVLFILDCQLVRVLLEQDFWQAKQVNS